MTDKVKMCILGTVTGIANGIFGSGGGIIAVPMLKKNGMEIKKAHACSLAVTLPLSAVSAAFYIGRHSFEYTEALKLAVPGLVGAVMGTILMKKISSVWLSGLFGVILIAAGIRNLLI